MAYLTESTVEEAALAWLESLDWEIKHGPEIAPGESFAERDDYREVVLNLRLRDALARLNPDLPHDALEDAFRKLTNPEGSALEACNRAFHRVLVDGVTVEYRSTIRGVQARVLDSEPPDGAFRACLRALGDTERTPLLGYYYHFTGLSKIARRPNFTSVNTRNQATDGRGPCNISSSRQ